MKRIWIVLGIILGIVVIAGAGYLGFRSSKAPAPIAPQAPQTVAATRCDVDQSVTAPGTVVNFNETSIKMPVDGNLDKILVQPGDNVKAGEPLATLKKDPLQLAKAQLAVAQAQADEINAQDALAKAKSALAGLNQPRTNGLTLERAQLYLATAQAQLNDAQKNYDSVSSLPLDDPQRLNALDALDAAKQAYTQAETNYNWLIGQPSTQDITAADAKVSVAEAGLALAQATLAKAQADLTLLNNTTIAAPFDGVLLASQAETGKFIPAGTSLFSLHKPNDVEIQANVTEEDFPYVQVGQKVRLYFDALPEVEASGAVNRILPKRISGDRALYDLYISLDSVPASLVDGMTSDGAILIAQQAQVVCLPRAVVHASSGNTATVKVWNGTTTVTRTIGIGLRGDVYVEITSGLEVGELVVTR